MNDTGEEALWSGREGSEGAGGRIEVTADAQNQPTKSTIKRRREMNSYRSNCLAFAALVVMATVIIAAMPGTLNAARDRGINQPGAAGNVGRDPGINQPGAAGNVGAGPGVDPGINQPGAAGNVGRDPGINQPGAAGNR
jgi:hypothetical protein